MKIFDYCRVSIREQAEHGYSIIDQWKIYRVDVE